MSSIDPISNISGVAGLMQGNGSIRTPADHGAAHFAGALPSTATALHSGGYTLSTPKPIAAIQGMPGPGPAAPSNQPTISY